MLKIAAGIFSALAFYATAAHADDAAIGNALRTKTQALADAVSAGDPRPWLAFLDSNVSFTDENGMLAGKDRMVAQVKPLPKGISGHIGIIDWRAHLFGDAAITTYVEDEFENYHGQHLHAQYRATDTWLLRDGDWKLAASQVIALQQDPPAVALPAATLDQYAGLYRAGPGLTYTVRREGAELIGQPSNGKAAPILFELKDVAFAAGQPRVRKLFQRDGTGRITGFLSRREGRDVVWRRIG